MEKDGEWLTYEEAGLRLGVQADSVRRRASARKWQRRPGNDGKARVLVPFEALPIVPDVSTDESGQETAAEVEIRMLRDRVQDLTRERDEWRSQAQALIIQRRSLWSRLLGR